MTRFVCDLSASIVRRHVTFVGALALLAFGPPKFAAAELRNDHVLAASNIAAPGLPPDTVFAGFDVTSSVRGLVLPALINDANETAFGARLSGPGVDSNNDGSVWTSAGGAMRLIAREGSQAPGTNAGVVFDSFGTVNISPSGDVSFVGTVRGPGVTSSNNSGIWLERNGVFTLVARSGNQAAGLPAGVVYGEFSDPLLASNGRLALIGYGMAGGGVTADNDSAVWIGSGNGVELLVREGDAAPGGANATFRNFESLSLGRGANVALVARLAGAGVSSANDFGVWAHDDQEQLGLLAREGNQAVGAPAGVTWRNLGGGTPFETPAVNGSGRVAFVASLAGGAFTNQGGLWRGDSEGLEMQFLNTQPLDGIPGGAFFFKGLPRTELVAPMNAGGDIVVLGETDRELFIKLTDNGPMLVAEEGMTAPGVAGATFSGFGDGAAINGRGQVAFQAFLTGSTNTSNDAGLWAQDQSGDLQLIVQKGDSIAVGNGDIRIVDSLGLTIGSGNEDGRRSSFNDQGVLAYWAHFTDGTEGVFYSHAVAVPEPQSISMLLAGCSLIAGVLLAQRRHRVCSRME